MNYKMSPLISLTLLAATLAGCSGTPAVVRTGDSVGMHFSCRLPNGELAVSTKPDAGQDSPVSRIYLKRTISDPLEVVVGGAKMDQPDLPPRLAFESDVAERLASALVGTKEDAVITKDLVAERITGLPENEQFVKMVKVRKRAKEQRMTLEDFKARTGKEAAVDQPFVSDPTVPGQVFSINGDEVLIRFAPIAQEINFPFGKSIVRETANQIEIDIQAVEGTLVRSGGLVGRISAVDNETFTIDYGHPFGGETLSCNVTVVSVKPADKKNAAQETAAITVEQPQNMPLSASVAPSNGILDTYAKKVFEEGMARMRAMSGQSEAAAEAARSGDLVKVNYTVTLEDGTLVATTIGTIANDQAVKKVSWYREPASYAPQELVAGKQEVMPGLGEALVGMKPGEKRRDNLSPDKAFGMSDPQKLLQLPCSQTFPKTIRMSADEYVKRFSAFPVLNNEVELLPYFKSRITEVTEHDAVLEFQVADGANFGDTFGTVSVSISGDKITTTLKPQVGSTFPLKEGFGVINATDGNTFTVDTNHPLAGKTIVLDLEAVSVSPPAAQAGAINWVDDHDSGMARAKQENKPVFLMLHADWCSWCKKTFTETMPDPRIMALKDRFVWVRVNSDKELKYKQKYGQEGYPMMVVLNPDGTVFKKIDGYRDARVLSEEIKAVLN